ncbi:hypothetical protein CROQUDRAFT_672073 [Cronartium quercuum f. sp. fusiforme G11]|uniref:Uncharacterized protein n=1 Tax=Cronartium quercuum f. sp. fusiforme G11 TaxID=708437 RepID=A0A9P6TA90_9BASI|nr:hypothetical protein CROQUDRAFT_672073 [Cronartium quercuum f. sp. fusiforme G11]
MESARHFRFPVPLSASNFSLQGSDTSSAFPLLGDTTRPLNGSITKSPTFSTISALVVKKGGIGTDGVTGETLAKIRRKISASILGPALATSFSGDWTLGIASNGISSKHIRTSHSSSGLHGTETVTCRRRGIARSVTGPLTRLFNHEDHDDGDDDDDEGWDFICCGEPPCRPERPGSGWFGTLDLKDKPLTKAFTDPTVTAAIDGPGVTGPTLGSAWTFDATWVQAWDLTAAKPSCRSSSPPEFQPSPGWSPASTDSSLASPVSYQSSLDHSLAPPATSLASPAWSLASPEIHHASSFPPSHLAEQKGFGITCRAKTSQLHV